MGKIYITNLKKRSEILIDLNVDFDAVDYNARVIGKLNRIREMR